MRLIDAEQLSKHKYVVGCEGAVDMGHISAVNILAYKWGWNDALDSVESFAPIADAESVRHGHWIRSSDGYWDECSKCHASIDISMGSDIYNADGDKVEYDWCPHCGAKMDEMDEMAVTYYADNKPALIDADKCPVCGGVRVNESDELLDICRQEYNYCPICGRFIGDEVKDGK